MAGNKDIVSLYLFELTERVTRFYIHLDEINTQFYLAKNPIVQDKKEFIDSYKECLLKILKMGIGYWKYYDSKNKLEDKDVEKFTKQIKTLISQIIELHTKHLLHLPRPAEPIELRRFSRIINKHLLNLNKKPFTSNKPKQISIYFTEDIGDATYKIDPLAEFKNESINSLIKKCNSDIKRETITEFKNLDKNNKAIHITIPRIDASNPCRWPNTYTRIRASHYGK